MKISLNLPNKLTLGRLGLCVLFVAALSYPWDYGGPTALAIFFVASLTDWLDGWIARRYGLITDLGKLLDPLADKVLISAAFVGLMASSSDLFTGPPMCIVVVIISREFLITGLRLVASSRGHILAAEKAGKHKTISQMIYVVISLLLLSAGQMDLLDLGFFKFLQVIQWWSLLFALLITIGSGAYYFYKNRHLFASDSDDDLTKPPPLPDLPPVIATPSSEGETTDLSPLSPSPKETFPAFKEWQIIVTALGRGDQSIILRKGGFAEGASGFQLKHQQFWLFPTLFHQQVEKTKLLPVPYSIEGLSEHGPVSLEYVAQVTQVGYLRDWALVTKLDRFHYWKEEVLRERFDWGPEPGLHCILVRVHRLAEPVILEWKPEYEGCKSWIELSCDFTQMASQPVLTDQAYHDLRAMILQTVNF